MWHEHKDTNQEVVTKHQKQPQNTIANGKGRGEGQILRGDI